ncbi:hypothetical protein CABS01_14152 [Colletotrichum abscissum]|uniref:Uncharacterized protein n=1 Tax=Colletotrichum abscissum TaxID=1671311 RepID=A0A9Q0AVQ4_9PEZI|nr:uncharacterized protein CABS01_14152 [Colletotrichum abscissum]KAI3537575.1 hypothetical protein CABS02_12052 [Colletotrichum abscissum]KAK1481954.1 hypothetical protein CABS01_14152 [Colletotrichum abscissum]
MDLIKIARLISDRLQLSERLTLSQVLRDPTPRRPAIIIEGSERKDEVGSPVATLRSKSRKMPLWLVHPGVGEIPVFMNLMRLINDRPVYAFPVAHLRALSDSDRWLELGLGEEEFVKWADLASPLQHLTRDYEPRGTIRSMDVFVADPLKEVAIDRKDWVLNKLSRWREFVSDVQCYDVPGEHYSMLDEVNVSRFAEKLKEVLEAREGPPRRTLQEVSPAALRSGLR